MAGGAAGTGIPGNGKEIFRDPPFFLPEFEEAFRYIIETYEPPEREIAIFLPCALRKPYSESPSHRLFHKVIESIIPPDLYHIVVFGTCGIVPGELESMYPFAHYHYMLGKCGNGKVLDAFLEIETYRIATYLKKTEKAYRKRVAYCIGPFREAMCRASQRSAIAVDLLLPSAATIEKTVTWTARFPMGPSPCRHTLTSSEPDLPCSQKMVNIPCFLLASPLFVPE